ncbi:hypothetical protein ACE193_07225 [Bernardetia sp. OM2101]|uniref:hypothetical protein n=1 Tax=Bernardetia sp. OM2101 TaxID=3344876 RepID=UPI0035CFE0A8
MIPIQHRDLEKLAQRHWELISKRDITDFSKTDYENVLKWCKDRNVKFETLVKAKPQELEKYAVQLKEEKYSSEIEKLKKLYEDFAKSTTQYGTRNNPYNAYHLVKELGIDVCPYCNRNYIQNIDEKTRKRTSEIDHFHPKEKFPFLAISFYNLIPSCKVCNHVKSSKKIDLNPYDERYWNKELLKFHLKIKDSKFYYDQNSIEIRLNLKDDIIKSNLKCFSLQSLYSSHKDQILELIQKQVTYPDSYIDELFQKYEGTFFRNREDVIRHLSNGIMEEENFHLRPLSKLTHDIAKELGLLD